MRETGAVDFHQQIERGRMHQAQPRVVLVSAAAEAAAVEAVATQAWRAQRAQQAWRRLPHLERLEVVGPHRSPPRHSVRVDAYAARAGC